MPKSKSKRPASLADSARPTPIDRKGPNFAVVIIETPKGSRNIYAYDAKERIFELKKVLPAGMAFPYDFGFVPSTIGGDGDAIDALVLMDEPTFVGCKVTCRLIGIIEVEQGSKNAMERNDVVIAIAAENRGFPLVNQLEDLGKRFLRELEKVFVNYHKLGGQNYRVLARKGPSAARRAINLASVKSG